MEDESENNPDESWDDDFNDDDEEEKEAELPPLVPMWAKFAITLLLVISVPIGGWIYSRMTRFDPKDGVVVNVITIQAFDLNVPAAASNALTAVEVRLSKSDLLIRAVPLEELEAGKYVEVIRLCNHEGFDDDTGLGNIFVARAKIPK
jgi:hypothetical protein